MALVMALPLNSEDPTEGSGLWCALTDGEATLWCPLEEELLFDRMLSIYQWLLATTNWRSYNNARNQRKGICQGLT